MVLVRHLRMWVIESIMDFSLARRQVYKDYIRAASSFFCSWSWR